MDTLGGALVGDLSGDVAIAVTSADADDNISTPGIQLVTPSLGATLKVASLTGAAQTTLNGLLTLSAQANLNALVVGVVTRSQGTNENPTSVLYGAQTMSAVSPVTIGAADHHGSWQLYRLGNPSTGAHTLDATWPATITDAMMIAAPVYDANSASHFGASAQINSNGLSNESTQSLSIAPETISGLVVVLLTNHASFFFDHQAIAPASLNAGGTLTLGATSRTYMISFAELTPGHASATTIMCSQAFAGNVSMIGTEIKPSQA